MKGDFTRFTFDPKKHYSGVRMQQGRVLLDSDWNEQADIFDHRSEIEAKDIIGRSGCPIEQSGFNIIQWTEDLTAEEQALIMEESPLVDEICNKINDLKPGDFIISAGRYYVDGIVCENEKTLNYSEQRHHPKLLNDVTPSEMARMYFPYIVCLDVWKRHISVIEDPEIRETALGGPDTTTRVETVWQVKALMPKIEVIDGCLDVSEIIPTLSTGRLNVKLSSSTTKSGKCSMAPRGGYQGLENRLYRVEIHDSGRPFGWQKDILDREGYPDNAGIYRIEYPQPSGDTIRDGKDGLIVVEDWYPDELSWRPGQIVEIFPPGSRENGTLARIKEADHSKMLLKLDLDISKLITLGQPDLMFHRVATFKWSKDNGSIAYSIEIPQDQPKKVLVKSLGRDKFLSLRAGDCVEILGDTTELACEPGTMVLVSENGADEANRELTLDQDVSRHKEENNPKIRRWDRSSSSSPEDMVSPITLDEVELEDGIVIAFSKNPGAEYMDVPSFRTGDYWTFPARSIDGKLKEIKDATAQGIEHHYACLARIPVNINENTTSGDEISFGKRLDCRKFFPSTTMMSVVSLRCVSGNNQETMPDPANAVTDPVAIARESFIPLAQSVTVQVISNCRPVTDTIVKFTALSGRVSSISNENISKCVSVPVDSQGLARCNWYLSLTIHGGHYLVYQELEATLESFCGVNSMYISPVPSPIRFTARLNAANDISYDPAACPKLTARVGTTTVQDAINSLCPANILYYVGGDGQDGLPNQVLPQKLQVMVADSRGPILSSMPVKFTAARGGGKVQVEGERAEDYCIVWTKDGIAECNWILGPSGDQQVETYLVDPINKNLIAGIKPIRFSANLNLAALVAYTPPKDCLKMSGISDVQSAINQLCPANILYAVSGNGQVGVPGKTLKLKAGVADSRGPVPGVPVQFKVLTEDPQVQPVSVSVDTGKDGIAVWDWKLGKLLPQQVEASLLDSDKKTVGLPVQFNAILNIADCIWYDPKSYPFMQNYNTVQEALDQLCSDQSDFNITGVGVMAEDGQTRRLLDNGATVRADLLVQGGLTISCSEKVDPASFRGGDLRTPVCMVSIEEPYFLPRTESIIGYHQLTLLGDAYVRTKDAPSLIIWGLSINASDALNTLSGYCSTQSDFEKDNGLILAHLVIKGNFIRSAENPDKYLDGDSFAIRPTTSRRPSNSFFPSGDGRAGGDFEMWFWISPPMTLNITPISDVRMGSLVTTKVKGTINMNMPAPIEMVINLSGTSNNSYITFSLDPSVTIKKDQNTADFYFIIKKGTVTSGTTSISLIATLNRWKTIATSITVNVII